MNAPSECSLSTVANYDHNRMLSAPSHQKWAVITIPCGPGYDSTKSVGHGDVSPARTDGGGLTVTERQRLKELERENRELRRSNDISRLASAYFAQAELDRHWKK